jgi:hypothetical protein
MKDGTIIGLSAGGAAAIIVLGVVGYFWNDLMPRTSLTMVADPTTQSTSIVQPKLKKYRVDVSGWITLETGESSLLRGLKIYVLDNPEMSEKQAKATGYETGANIYLSGMAYKWMYATDAERFCRGIESDAKLVGTLGVDGTAKLEFVAPETARIWASFKTANSQTAWIIGLPDDSESVTIHSGNTLFVAKEPRKSTRD